mgnify:FL=1|jgi:hypothetical protein
MAAIVVAKAFPLPEDTSGFSNRSWGGVTYRSRIQMFRKATGFP